MTTYGWGRELYKAVRGMVALPVFFAPVVEGTQFDIFGSAKGLDRKATLLLLGYEPKPVRLLGRHALEFARKANGMDRGGKYVVGGADTLLQQSIYPPCQ